MRSFVRRVWLSSWAITGALCLVGSAEGCSDSSDEGGTSSTDGVDASSDGALGASDGAPRSEDGAAEDGGLDAADASPPCDTSKPFGSPVLVELQGVVPGIGWSPTMVAKRSSPVSSSPMVDRRRPIESGRRDARRGKSNGRTSPQRRTSGASQATTSRRGSRGIAAPSIWRATGMGRIASTWRRVPSSPLACRRDPTSRSRSAARSRPIPSGLSASTSCRNRLGRPRGVRSAAPIELAHACTVDRRRALPHSRGS